MQIHSSSIDTTRGAPLRDASVLVTNDSGIATIYDAAGAVQANPMTTDSTGSFSFRAANGEYTLTITKTGVTTKSQKVQLYDPADDDIRAEVPGAALSVYQRMSRKRIAHRLPLMFPDYAAIIAATGVSYIYPQAFAIDDTADEVFVMYCASSDGSSVKWVAVFDRSTDEYKSCFNVGPNRISEGLVIRYEGASRYLYTEDSAETLGKYNITTLPATMANIPASATYAVGMDRQFDHRNGVFLIEQNGTPLGYNTSRTTLAWFDSSLNRMGAVSFDKSDCGFTASTDSAYAPYLPKRQNFALGDGIILGSYGGYTAADGTSTPYGYQGIKVFTLNGDRLAESLMDPLLMIGIMEDNGVTCTRIENEGVVVDASGGIYSLYVHQSRLDASASTEGVIIFEEFSTHPSAIDFSPAVKAHRAYDQGEIEDGIWPRADGLIRDPILGTEITTLDAMLSFMAAMDVKGASFYGSSNTITDINGAEIGTGKLVTIRNANNNNFFVTILDATAGPSHWFITGDAGARTQSTVAASGFFSAIRLAGSQADATSKFNRFRALHYLNAEEDFLAFDIQSTATNNSVMYGGGSALYNAATRHIFYTAPNGTTLTGTERMRIDDADGVVILPKSTAVPNNNGEMTFELTSNTSLTVRVKGSDGTVRSAALTLA